LTRRRSPAKKVKENTQNAEVKATES